MTRRIAYALALALVPVLIWAGPDIVTTAIKVTAPITGKGTSGSPIACRTATDAVSGCMSAADHTTFTGLAPKASPTFTGTMTTGTGGVVPPSNGGASLGTNATRWQYVYAKDGISVNSARYICLDGGDPAVSCTDAITYSNGSSPQYIGTAVGGHAWQNSNGVYIGRSDQSAAMITKSAEGTTTLSGASNVTAQTCSELSVTVTGAAAGDECVLGLPATFSSNMVYTCRFSASDAGKLRVCNVTGSDAAPPDGVYRLRSLNH